MKKLLIAALLIAGLPAQAATFGRVSGGQALDVITGPSLSAALSGRFVDGYNPQPYWTPVPDTDTTGAPLRSGAHDNGNGTFTNPPAASSAAVALSVTDFKKRFTFAERTALLSSQDPGVKVFLDELNTATQVHLDDPDTVAGLAYMVQMGLLTAARRDQILAP